MAGLSQERFSILGLARTGVATANYLASHGADVQVSDQKAARDLPLDKLHVSVSVRAGENHVRTGDVVVISPGIKPGSAAWNLAHQEGAEVLSDIELFSRLCPCPVIAVTGTDGKSTTVSLIGEMLSASGRHVFVGGNIGNACMSGLSELTTKSIAVLEVSCFQLTHCHRLAPLVSVVTNIAEDHVEYHGSMEAYIAAKQRLFRNAGPGDRIVVNGGDPEIAGWTFPAGAEIVRFGWTPDCDVHADRERTWLGDAPLVRHDELRLQGLHNVENVMAAVAAVEGLFTPISGAPLDALVGYPGLEHRMEYVATIAGVSYFNDSKATNPHAASAVLNAFDERFWLLAGGYEKGSSFAEFGRLIAQKTLGALLFAQTAARLKDAIPEGHPVHVLEAMDEAVALSLKLASPGEKVILAPACASFGQFTDYEHRGRVFKRLVRALDRDSQEQ